MCSGQNNNNNTVVSGNAGTKKIFTRVAAKKKIFINLIELSPIFYCLNGKKRKFVQINLLVEIFLFVCFFETKNIYSHTHSTYAGGQVIKKFSLGRFPEIRLLFFGLSNLTIINNTF